MRRCLLVIHIGATSYVAHWTAFLAMGAGLGVSTIMIPLQALSICCLLGMVYAAGADPNHWTRRHLGGLNLGAAGATFLWTVGYSEGPFYRAVAAQASAARAEAIIGIVVMIGLVVGVSLWLVRRATANTYEDGGSERGLIALSGFIWAAGSFPWLWTMINTPDPVQRSYAWGSATVGLMELGTVIATCVAGIQLLRGSRLATGVAFAEALAVPLLVRLAGW